MMQMESGSLSAICSVLSDFCEERETQYRQSVVGFFSNSDPRTSSTAPTVIAESATLNVQNL
ncbi:MAG TPA: hypothetical protein VM100_12035, partial [Longimicrobiales bacterium]|nr:hypothetical protein [Longimicrobiales bacterium]